MGQVTFNVRLGTSGITPTALVEKGRNHATMLNGNAAFPTPDPTLVVLNAACDKLDAANQAYDFNRGKTEKEARNEAFKELLDLVRDLAAYVQLNCNNERELIVSTGFDVRSDASALGRLPAPGNLRSIVAPYPGTIELRWGGVRGRQNYRVEYTSGDPSLTTGWSLLTVTGKTRFSVEGLDSDKVYGFRVFAIGAAGASPVSDVTVAKAA